MSKLRRVPGGGAFVRFAAAVAVAGTAVGAVEHLHRVANDLGGFPLFAVLRFVGTDRETALDQARHALLQIRVARLCELVPRDDVDVIGLFLLLRAAVDRERELGDGGAGADITDLRIAG